MGKASELRRLLHSGGTLVMPDAYDPLSARIIEKLGFKAVQCSGYSFALAACWSSEAELVKEINGPVSIAAGLPNNIRNFSVKELRECGVARVSLPTVVIFSAIAGMVRCLESIGHCDEFSEVVANDLLCSPQRLADLMGR